MRFVCYLTQEQVLDHTAGDRVNGWTQYKNTPLHPDNTTANLDVQDILYKAESCAIKRDCCVVPRSRSKRARVAVYAVDGMGQLLLPGPTGPLSTLHFEAHRDGFEDHAMLTLLRTVVQNASRLHVDCASEAKALEIPSELAAPAPWCPTSLSNVEWCGPKAPLVDDDPAVLLEHRTNVALAIAGCRAKLGLVEAAPREQRSSRTYKSDEGDYMLAVPGAVTDAGDARLVLAPVTKRPDPVLSPTAPWELATLNGNPHAVLGDDGTTVQLYYSAQTTCKVEPGIPTGHCPSPLWLERWQPAHYPAYLNLSDHEMRLLATSADGFTFTRKPIGRFPAFNGSSPQALSSGGIKNNVVLPFKTKIAKIAAKRFAALGMQGDCGYNGLADGRPDWNTAAERCSTPSMV